MLVVLGYIPKVIVFIFFHWLRDGEMVTARARFALKMTASNILTYKFVSLNERRRLQSCAFIISKVIVFAFVHSLAVRRRFLPWKWLCYITKH